ncbi:hypothetical protein KPH14_009798 [Odynerus spinipes]|uniref:Uncharacterized protein n=1 Tax=Odynerus spinipes TaxID=1348599 RepID=A0AAD9RVT6_9HYME|nr:hypothetical protein KPH14_009798 [Odynerus spinipes]
MLKEVLFLVLAALCLSDAISIKSHTADMEFSQKQKKIYELLMYVKQNVLTDAEFYTVGRNYDIETNIDMYTDKNVVQEFLYWYRHDPLNRDAIFSPFYEEHRNEMILLFKLFYSAKDFQIFYKTAAWARIHLHDSLFTSAFYVAVFYRPDCKYIQLMPPYEVYPHLFFDSNVIQEAHRIKMTRGLTTSGIDHVDSYMIYNNFTDRSFNNEEYKLDYFMEDFGLNSFYYYFRQIFPSWMSSKEYNLPQEIRGSFYLYIHQQLIARYFLERMSNGLGEIEDFDWQKPFYPGFYSSLMYSNGVVMPQRKSYSTIPFYKFGCLKEIESLELRFMNAIDSGYVLDRNGKFVSIYTPDGLNILGNIIEGNADTYNSRYYGMYEFLARNILGYHIDFVNKNKVVPTAMHLYSTSMRDPAFYRLFNRISEFMYRFKQYAPAYTQTDLIFPGVKIESVNMEKLWTYFDYCDATINNAVYVENFKEGSSLRIKARRPCLNYKRFTYHLNVNSDKDTKAVLRIFLGPAFEGMSEDVNYLQKYYKYFVEMDRFVVPLKPGMNNIERQSSDSAFTMSDMISSDVFYKKLSKAVSGSEPLTYYEKLFGYPERLTLPKGKPEGMKFKMFFYLSPYDESKVQDIELPIFGKLMYDGKPCGFPLDRPTFTWKFFTPNMFFQDVFIYNSMDTEKFTKY